MPVRSDTKRLGIRLSLIVERDVYPRNAPIRPIVRIENVSGDTVVVQEFRTWNPQVTVRTDQGEIVFRSGDPLWSPPSHGPAPMYPIRLPPGAAIDQRVYVILRAGHLQASVALLHEGRQTGIDSPDLRLELTDGIDPRLAIHTDPVTFAELEPASRVDGPLVYQTVSTCRHGESQTSSGGTRFHGTMAWIAAADNRLVPDWDEDCGFPGTWRAVAGWINHPVMWIDHRSPERTDQ